MLSCGICLDTLNAPVALICGHVFCEDCVVRIIHSVKPFRTSHSCPTCRNTFSIVNMSPAFVPAHLRPYVSPSVRRLYLDHSTCSSSSTTNTVPPTGALSSPAPAPDMAATVAQLEAQNAALRSSCEKWRRQAEVHATARYQLLELAQASRSYSHHLEKENGELRRRVDVLSRDFRIGAPIAPSSPSSSSSSSLCSVPTSPGQPSSSSSSSPSSLASTSSSPFLSSYQHTSQDEAASSSSSSKPPVPEWSHPYHHHQPTSPTLPSPGAFSPTRMHTLSPQLSRPQHTRSLSDPITVASSFTTSLSAPEAPEIPEAEVADGTTEPAEMLDVGGNAICGHTTQNRGRGSCHCAGSCSESSSSTPLTFGSTSLASNSTSLVSVRKRKRSNTAPEASTTGTSVSGTAVSMFDASSSPSSIASRPLKRACRQVNA